MTLALRRTEFLDSERRPDDFTKSAVTAGPLGRIYRMKAGRELWRWTIRLEAPPTGPSGGLSATLDEAMAAFRAKWETER
jgi:hypothetical protein